CFLLVLFCLSSEFSSSLSFLDCSDLFSCHFSTVLNVGNVICPTIFRSNFTASDYAKVSLSIRENVLNRELVRNNEIFKTFSCKGKLICTVFVTCNFNGEC